MIQEQLTKQNNAMIDWAASYIRRSYARVQQDHQSAALFKSILMTVDPNHFKHLLNQATSIKQLQLEITRYFHDRLHQTKQSCLQGGTDRYDSMKILVMFKILLELSYVVGKEQCNMAIQSLEPGEKEVIEKILQEIIKDRKGRSGPSANHSQQVIKLKEESKRLRLMIQSLRINESELIQKNLDLQSRLEESVSLSQQKDRKVQESNRKVEALEGIIREISLQILDQAPALGSLPIEEDHSNINGHEVPGKGDREEKQSGDWYVMQLQNKCRSSTDVVGKYARLKEMHEVFKNQVASIIEK